MAEDNAALEAVLERGRAGEESDAVLAAIVDGGVVVPTDRDGGVVFLSDDNSAVLPGYVSQESRERWLPSSAGGMLCDALRLLDISKHTGVQTLVVFAGEQSAKVPLGLVARTLRERGMRTSGPMTMRLTWSTHPFALALRKAIADRILSYPGVRTVWIAYASHIESGNEHFMLHIAVDEHGRAAAKSLLETVLAEDVHPGPDDPDLALRVLTPAESDAGEELDRMGLDTVRADHAGARVHVISREFD